jgi:outer membrane protein assembly factor BamD (BamD/ComL family)
MNVNNQSKTTKTMVALPRKTRLQGFVKLFFVAVAALSVPSFTVLAPALASPRTQQNNFQSQKNTADQSIDELFNQGIAAHNAGKYSQAEAIWA